MKKLVATLMLVFISLEAHSAVRVEIMDPAYDEFEGLDLAEALIRDGRAAEASPLLVTTAKGRESRRLKLQGDLAFALGKDPEALAKWDASLARAETSLEEKHALHRRRAQAWARMGNSQECVNEFKKVPSSKDEKEVLLRTSCLEKTAKLEEAWRVLSQATESPTIEKERLAFLLRRGLRQVAFERVQAQIQAQGQASPSREALLNSADLFETHGALRESFRLLEIARVQWPQDVEVLLTWARAAHREGLTLAVAEAYEIAATSEGKYYYHAAELWRQARQFERSKRMNTMIVDETEQLKQKIALAVDQGRYDRILSLTGALSRSPLAKDDDVNYAVSYAFARVGNREGALHSLDRVTRADLLSKAAALRKTLVE